MIYRLLILSTLIFYNNSIASNKSIAETIELMAEASERLEQECSKYNKVRADTARLTPFIKGVDLNIRKVLLRELVSTEDYKSFHENYLKGIQNGFSGSTHLLKCLSFHPIKSNLVDRFTKKEVLFIDYSSKIQIPLISEPNIELLLKQVDIELKDVLEKFEPLAKSLGINYIVIFPAIDMILTINGQEQVMPYKGGKNYHFYSYEYVNWHQETH